MRVAHGASLAANAFCVRAVVRQAHPRLSASPHDNTDASSIDRHRHRARPHGTWRGGTGDAPAPAAERQRTAHCVRIRQQHLDRRPQRRCRTPTHVVSGQLGAAEALARRQDRRIHRHVCRQCRCLHRADRGGRAGTPHLASRPRWRHRLDARWQAHRVLQHTSDRRTVGNTPLLQCLDRGRTRGGHADAARIPGAHQCRRYAHRISHGQFVGRRAPQLSRRAEQADLGDEPQDLRRRHDRAAAELEGARPRMDRG